MSEGQRMIFSLTLIAMVSALILSLIFQVTEPVIEANRQRELELAVLEVVPRAVEIRLIEELSSDETVYGGIDGDGALAGYALVSEANGYNGPIRVLIGIDHNSGQVIGLKILEHTETPGLGSEIESHRFLRQFIARDETSAITIDEDIDNITGATVSAAAVARAVRTGLRETELEFGELRSVEP